MKKIVTVILILSFNLIGISQETTSDSILTEKENVEWVLELEKLTSKSDQIIKIKEKIYTDSAYTKNNRLRGCRVFIKDQESLKEQLKKANCECKITFILGFKKRFHLLDLNENPKTNEILGLISEKNIDNITIIKGDVAAALYGSNGRCGVIVLNSNNRKLKRQIERLL